MKTLITATAVLMLFASAASAQDRAQEYRMWSAEQTIKRLNGTAPQMAERIREVAASGDDVRWAEIIDMVHQFELDTARAEFRAEYERRAAEKEQNRASFDLQRARQSVDNYYSRHPLR